MTHPISQGLTAPTREMLGELLLKLGHPANATRAANRSGDAVKARKYYTDLLELAKSADSERPALIEAKAFVGQQQRKR